MKNINGNNYCFLTHHTFCIDTETEELLFGTDV